MNGDVESGDFWTAQTLKPGDWRLWEAGTLRLWARRENNEWHVTSDREANEGESLALGQGHPPPATASWQRWAFKENQPVIRVAPAMPDNPVVIRPDAPIRIPPGNEVTFFVSIPVFLQIYLGPQKELFIHEEASAILSKTWFGDPTAGELCYASRTGASRNLDGIRRGRHRAISPILIKNNSRTELHFEKLCVRVAHVNIYRGARRLWTEEIQFNYRGENNSSEISFSKGPPAFEQILEVLTTAREPIPRGNLLRKSFGSLWAF